MRHVCVVGLGYIGLPTAALLAQAGHQVTGVDIDSDKVETINTGVSPMAEPGLGDMVRSQVLSESMVARTAPVAADIFLIIVPTPFNNADKTADMRYVRQAAADITSHLVPGNLVVLESTSALGATARDVAEVIFDLRPELKDQIDIAFCPERAIPGDTLRELIENDRVVGGMTPEATEKAVTFYQSFVTGDVLATDAKTAEMVKLAENTFRDINIAFANEMSVVCDTLGLNVWEVIRLANHHPRVNIMQPGPGVGGHCIAVDPWFIHTAAPAVSPLIRTAREVNDSKPQWVVAKITAALQENPGARVGLLGMAYKPNIDDLRESPSLKVAQLLKAQQPDTQIIVCEPYTDTITGFDNRNLADTLANSDIVVMLTDHQAFRDLARDTFAGKTLIDTRGIYQEKGSFTPCQS